MAIEHPVVARDILISLGNKLPINLVIEATDFSSIAYLLRLSENDLQKLKQDCEGQKTCYLSYNESADGSYLYGLSKL